MGVVVVFRRCGIGPFPPRMPALQTRPTLRILLYFDVMGTFSSMVKNEQFIAPASVFPEVSVEPHFETICFGVNKKIFATINPPERRACVKFDALQQDLFCSFDRSVIYPVPNKLGHARLDEHQPEEGAVAYLKGRIEDGVLSDGSRKLAAQVDAGLA